MKKIFFISVIFLFAVLINSVKAQNIYTVTGTGVIGYTGNGGPAISATLYSPNAVGFDKVGNFYITDEQNDVVREVNISTGIITTVAGDGVGGYSGDGGPATSAEMNWDIDVVFDAAGNMYISELVGDRIRKVDKITGIITTLVGTGIVGFSGDGGPANAAEIDNPRYMAIDASNNLFFADQGNNRIRKVVLSTGIISTVIGTGVAGYSGDGGPAAAAQLNGPYGITFDNFGNMYIGDQYNYCVREVNISTGIITTVVGTGTVSGFSGDGGLAINAKLSAAASVTIGPTGNMYIADTYNHRIRKVTKSTGIISTVVGTGVGGYNGDAIPAVTAEIYFPANAVLDSCGSLYISDWGNERIRKVLGVDAGYIGGNAFICSGNADTLTAYGGSTYLWSNAATSSSIIVNPTITTTYSVHITGGCLTSVDTSFTVAINNTLSISLSGNNNICQGQTTTLSASGGTSYLWSNSATTSSISVTPANTTTYSVAISNAGCTKDTAIIVDVNPPPTVSLTGNDTVCSGYSTTIAASGGSTYLWSNGATTSSISPSPLISTTYTVKVSNGGCTKDTTVNVFVNLSPTLITGSSVDTICAGDSVKLNVSGANHYTWAPPNGLSCVNCSNPTATPTVSITYTVTGYGSDGCTSEKIISVIVSTPPILDSIPSPTVCAGGHVTLVTNILSGFGGTYVWQPGGSTGGTITVSPTTTTTYTVQYTNACGTTSAHVTVTVSPMPNPDFSADVMTGCAPLCIQFRDLSSTIPAQGAEVSMWRWIFGDGDTLNEQNPIYCYPDTGTFTPSLTAISTSGCSATLQIDKMITVYSKPIANFIYSPEPVSILAPTVQFTDKSTDAYGISFWAWRFGDGEATTGQNSLRNPIHTYQDTGTYCPQLIVENNKGCVDTLTQCLFVNPLFTLYIPSAFSPNGDGVNDVFEPKGTYIKHFEMYIFDRWGMELYYTNDLYKGWPGTVKGGTNICQEDSYVYKITAWDWSNTQHSYIGEVTLVK